MANPCISIQGKGCGKLRNGTVIFSESKSGLIQSTVMEHSFTGREKRGLFSRSGAVAAVDPLRREEPQIQPVDVRDHGIWPTAWQWAVKVAASQLLIVLTAEFLKTVGFFCVGKEALLRSSSVLFLALVVTVQFGIGAMSYTNIPQGGSVSLSGDKLAGHSHN